jgi:hypothetical protein
MELTEYSAWIWIVLGSFLAIISKARVTQTYLLKSFCEMMFIVLAPTVHSFTVQPGSDWSTCQLACRDRAGAVGFTFGLVAITDFAA